MRKKRRSPVLGYLWKAGAAALAVYMAITCLSLLSRTEAARQERDELARAEARLRQDNAELEQIVRELKSLDGDIGDINQNSLPENIRDFIVKELREKGYGLQNEFVFKDAFGR